MADQNKIRELHAKLSALYAFRSEEYPRSPVVFRAKEWIYFAHQYSQAATVVSRSSLSLLLPAIQLNGQAVELALKACLGASNIEPPNDHNLVSLYSQVHDAGISISEFHQACIVHLSHFYHRDVATGTKYKARYPTTRAEKLGGAMPEQEHFTALVEHLCGQAERRADAAAAALLDGCKKATPSLDSDA